MCFNPAEASAGADFASNSPLLVRPIDAITAGHVAGLAHGNPELVDISTLKVQHRRSPFQNGRPARFPADPIVHPAFAGALGMNESEKL